MIKPIDRIGKSYGRITVIALAPKNPVTGVTRFDCQCACGARLTVEGSNVRRSSYGCKTCALRMKGSALRVITLLNSAPSTAIDASKWIDTQTDESVACVWSAMLLDLHLTGEHARHMLPLIRQIHARLPGMPGRAIPPERWPTEPDDAVAWLSKAPRATVAKHWPDCIEACYPKLTTGTLGRCCLLIRTRCYGVQSNERKEAQEWPQSQQDALRPLVPSPARRISPSLPPTRTAKPRAVCG